MAALSNSFENEQIYIPSALHLVKEAAGASASHLLQESARVAAEDARRPE
jgi:hypothetical protein